MFFLGGIHSICQEPATWCLFFQEAEDIQVMTAVSWIAFLRSEHVGTCPTALLIYWPWGTHDTCFGPCVGFSNTTTFYCENNKVETTPPYRNSSPQNEIYLLSCHFKTERLSSIEHERYYWYSHFAIWSTVTPSSCFLKNKHQATDFIDEVTYLHIYK